MRGIVWWECLRIGVGEEVDLVIGGERLVMVAVEVICGTFVVRKMARLHPRLSWETLPPLLGVVPWLVGVDTEVVGGRGMVSG